MAKAKKTVFFCQQCGYESVKWMGQCPGCREWNTFVEEPAEEAVPEVAVEPDLLPPQAARPRAAAPTPATLRKLRREMRFIMCPPS